MTKTTPMLDEACEIITQSNADLPTGHSPLKPGTVMATQSMDDFKDLPESTKSAIMANVTTNFCHK
ncbi:hypothetical protein [Marinobacterium jannaschii]|uniref:hypothetical protein n=1 Tax=Marinobacterium jannaschii TaxID=64970 RepID=UPI0012EB7B45|nr:hypothetical protein [Marinobacterium jannaschii]